MKQVVFASGIGALICAALMFVVNPVFALICGFGVGYFAYQWGEETWPAIKFCLQRFPTKSFVAVLGLALLLVALVVFFGYETVLYGTWQAIKWIVISLIALLLASATTAFGGWLIMGFGAFPTNLGIYLITQGNNCWLDREMNDADIYPWKGWLFIYLLPIGLPLLALAIVYRVTVEIYKRERVLCGLSAALGGWIGYATTWVHPSPVLGVAIGAVAGASLGALQFRFITQPIRSFQVKANKA